MKFVPRFSKTPPGAPPAGQDASPEANQQAVSFTQMLAAELAEIDLRASLRKKEDEEAARAAQTEAGAPKIGLEKEHPELLFPDRLWQASQREKLGEPQCAPASPGPNETWPMHAANQRGLLGLAFSGGGIRSATFNLGVLQGLAQRGLLRRFDYLSTVSGGGYIGAWLAAWVNRRGMREVEARLAADRKDQPDFREPPEIRFLREYSSYLTPRKGFLGADTWTAIAIYLRNLVLNQLVLFLFLSAILLAPWGLTAFASTHYDLFLIARSLPSRSEFAWSLIGLALGGLAALVAGLSMTTYSDDPPDRVLARVTGTGESRETLRVHSLLGADPRRWKLLKRKPRIQIWDSSIKTNRNPSRTLKIRSFGLDPSHGLLTLTHRVSAKLGDSIVVPGGAEGTLLAQMTESCERSKTLPVEFLLDGEGRRKLLKSRPAVEILDPRSKANRNPATPARISRFDESPVSLTLSHPANARDKDLVVAIYPSLTQRKWVSWLVAVPTFVGATLLALLLVATRLPHPNSPPVWLFPSSFQFWARVGTEVMYLLWVLTFLLKSVNIDAPERGWLRENLSIAAAVLSPLVAGIGGGFLLSRLVPVLQQWAMEPAGMWQVLGFGVPLLALILLGSTVIQIGILGVCFAEPRREWWARLAALLLVIGFGWAGAFALAGYGPLLMTLLQVSYRQSAVLAALGWIVSTGLGLFGGKSARTGGLESKTRTEALLSVTPYIFIVGLLILMAWGWQAVLFRAAGLPSSPLAPPGISQIYWKNLECTLRQFHIIPWFPGPAILYFAAPLFLVASYFLALRIDINEFSMHYLYRNRLVRCYLGASDRERVPNPMTGFSVHDEIHLADLSVSKSAYDGPIPIFCSALNLVKGKDLAWQDRKAESFAMTPLHCGYDVWFERLARPGELARKKLEAFGYRPTVRYAYPKGFYLGTAMAISGAAASPNMGYHSSPALAFLMTVFNVRLGWWVGNTRHRTGWRDPGPLVGLGYLLAELFGATDDDRKYVYLSDGGHFENLGIYELVKRRCRFILASDAGADKDFAFSDLASAIQKCRSDMGIEIRIRTDPIAATGAPPFSRWHCVAGEIRYQDSDPCAQNGILVYIKPSLTSDEPADVLNYKSRHPDFPHETTADQWFTEPQFESYRALGQHVIQTLLLDLCPGVPDLGSQPAEITFRALESIWNAPQTIRIPGTRDGTA